MTKKRNRKSRKIRKDDRSYAEMALGMRNWTAVAAFQRGGGGVHQDRRTRRTRTRAEQKRTALAEY